MKFAIIFTIKHTNIVTLHRKSPLKQSFTAHKRYGHEGCDCGCTCVIMYDCIVLALLNNDVFETARWLFFVNCESKMIKGVLHPWALFLKTLCIFPKNKATSDKVSYGSGQKCSKELKNLSFTSVETILVKLQWKMCENQYFPCFEP